MTDKNKVKKYKGPCFDSCYNFYSSPDDWKKEAGPGRIERFFEAKKVPFLKKLNSRSLINSFFASAHIEAMASIKGIKSLTDAVTEFKEVNKDVCCYEPDFAKGFWVGSEESE